MLLPCYQKRYSILYYFFFSFILPYSNYFSFLLSTLTRLHGTRNYNAFGTLRLFRSVLYWLVLSLPAKCLSLLVLTPSRILTFDIWAQLLQQRTSWNRVLKSLHKYHSENQFFTFFLWHVLRVLTSLSGLGHSRCSPTRWWTHGRCSSSDEPCLPGRRPASWWSFAQWGRVNTTSLTPSRESFASWLSTSDARLY